MDKFNFKLQKVLEFKETYEEKKKEEFSLELRNFYEQEKRLKELKEEKERTINNPPKFKMILDYQGFYRYLELLDRRIEKQAHVLNEAKERLEKARQELIKATKDRSIIEKLKEKAYEEFLEEQNKKEQRLNDDYALYLYLRGEGR
ncbi:MAG: flagellar export protein FliJ [Caloramator sp.]|nr:flagellar export protein FliJ [Caloramator sp.]